MVAALPPEADTVAGKANTPMEMRGQLVWEHDDINNMGFAVKPAKGQARAFVYDMSIGGGAHDIIRTLIERESGNAIPGARHGHGSKAGLTMASAGWSTACQRPRPSGI